ACVNPLGLIRERGVARDHEHTVDARQIGRQVFGNPVRKVLLLGVVAQIGERQYDNREPWNGCCRRPWWWDGNCVNRVGAHLPSDVLKLLLTEIAKNKVELTS